MGTGNEPLRKAQADFFFFKESQKSALSRRASAKHRCILDPPAEKTRTFYSSKDLNFPAVFRKGI